MASGVAKAIAVKWPVVKERYHAMNPHGMVLGAILPVRVSDDIVVVNCFTQEWYGSDGNVYASPVAIFDCLVAVCESYQHHVLDTIYLPKIGCGLGGLDWDTCVFHIIKEFDENYTYNFVVCDI